MGANRTGNVPVSPLAGLAEMQKKASDSQAYAPPGRGSPWGDPTLSGDNNSFYQKQFASLLRGDQNFQKAQEVSAVRRYLSDIAAERQPSAPPVYVKPAPAGGTAGGAAGGGGGVSASEYTRDPWIKPGVTTNAEFYRHYGGNNPNFAYNSPSGMATDWGMQADPRNMIANIGPNVSPSWANEISGIWNKGWTQNNGVQTPAGGGPSAAPGYVAPV